METTRPDIPSTARLRAGGADALAPAGRPRLHVLRLGPQARIDVPAGWISATVPMAGPLRCESVGDAWSLPAREVLVWRDGALRATAARAALVVAGPSAAWQARLQAAAEPGDLPVLLPSEGRASPALRRAALRLARAAHAGTAASLAARLDALARALLEEQRDLRARVPRCTGRTAERREHTMLRLLRVQHLIRRHADGRLDAARMARCASYSPCHLIRVHRDVFGETPAEYAARLRDRRAWQLVRDTDMPVAAITDVLGFESASAFCRAFKASFGVTATQARRGAGERCAQAA